jgi:L-proline amide hydrolase
MIPEPAVTGTVPFGDYKTWYRITGDLTSSATPLVVLNGGPGCSHDYVLSIANVANSGRAVVHYDQIGSGRSTLLPEKDADFLTVEFYLAELNNLLVHFDIEDDYFILGQSWGAMLGAEHAVLCPSGLKGLVLSNGLASAATWASEAKRLIGEMPAKHRNVLEQALRTGDFTSDAFKESEGAYYDVHVCRVTPKPREYDVTTEYMDVDGTVYATMWGPSEFAPTGSLVNWSIVERLSQIVAPTLVVSGRHDEATPLVQKEFMDNISHAEQIILENSSHMPFIEEPELYIQRVNAFLEKCESN